MQDQDYPNYFIAGNSASLKAQSNYITLVKWDLILMVISATLSIYNYQSIESKTMFYVISAILLSVAFIISIYLKIRRYEDTWYRARALAESCKTLTWRFIMCSEYFEINISNSDAEKRFNKRIGEIYNEFSDLKNEISLKQLNTPIITSEMTRIRALSLKHKKTYYLDNRIQNQINWYTSKGENSKLKYNIWFCLIIFLQFLAIVSIVYLIKYPSSNFNLVGVFSTIAASGFSWLQVNKYQENKEAYTTANSELNLIKAEGNRIFTNDEFSKYVLDSENAMSREHTMWLAQKRM